MRPEALIALSLLCCDATQEAKQLLKVSEDHLSFELVDETLAYLRSPALNVEGAKIRSVGVAGAARKGKSFFLNALFQGKSRPFEVGSAMSGVTQGMWFSTLDLGAAESTNSTDITVLIDIEGIGAAHSTPDFNNKLVALGAMVSSVLFYNNNADINQHDVEEVYEAVLLNDLMQSKVNGSSALVWLVQNWYRTDDECAKYPEEVFLSEKPASEDERIKKYNSIAKTVKKHGTHIFCLPSPSSGKNSRDLESVAFDDFDAAYREEIARVRLFIDARLTQQASRSFKGGANLADWLEIMVPLLNNIQDRTRAYISGKAKMCASDLKDEAKKELEGLENALTCPKARRVCPSTDNQEETKSRSAEMLKKACAALPGVLQKRFDDCAIGDGTMRENSAHRMELVAPKSYVSHVLCN
jgi:hypothetical protein